MSWKLKIAALLISGACLMVWGLPPLTRQQGFFGCYSLGQLAVGLVCLGTGLGLWLVALSPVERQRVMAFRVCAVLGTVAVGWLGVELTYAIVSPAPINPFYQVDPKWNLPDPELGFVRKPDISWTGRAYDDPQAHEVLYRTDRSGFRNPPGITQADLVFIGDSFTEAGNVPEQDTFVRLVARELGVTAANLGRGYYGPQHELIVLRRYALAYEPKTIVWVVFEGNDLLDAQRYLHGVLDRPQAPPGQRNAWSSRALLTYRLLRPFLKEAPPPPEDQDGTWLLVSPTGEQRQVDLTVVYRPDLLQRMPEAWEATKRSIRQGLSLCAERRIELLVVFVPIKFRVYGPFLRLITPEQEYLGPLPEDLTRPEDFSSQLARFCEEIGCKYLDTYPALLAAAERGQTVYSLRYDTHFDLAGHRVVADLITQALSGRGAALPPANASTGAHSPPG